MTVHVMKTPQIRVTVKAEGAELTSLQGSYGSEYLWQGGVPWHRHAPNLFPIVGRLKNHRFRHRGQEYILTQHGFARDAYFHWDERQPGFCRLSLHDTDQTRAIYPFPFLFTVEYRLSDDTLIITYTVTNTGEDLLPASMGAHPAFRWPLSDGIKKDAYFLEFEKEETRPVRRIVDGLLSPQTFPTPVQGRTLWLREDLFRHDAVIMDNPASRAVTFKSSGATGIKLSWDNGFREFGIWSRPDDDNPAHCADFLCLEPWHGMSSPIDFDGEITEKPGMMLIPPGEHRTASYKIQLIHQE